MASRWQHWTLPLLLLSSGCSVAALAIIIPVVILNRIAVAFAWILVGDGSVAEDAELRASGIRIERRVVEFDVAEDLTFTGTLEETKVITSVSGLAAAQFESISFNPDTQSLELEEAHVEMPDGSTVPVAKEHVFTRPSAAAQDAPEFVSSSSTTVIFPQLRVGAKTSVRWRFTERGRSLFGFNYCWRPTLTLPVDAAVVRIRCDEEVALRHAVRGAFEVTESLQGGIKVVEAVLRGYPGAAAERSMVSPRDVCPLFEATTVSSWEEIGAQFHAAVADRIEVTPEIEELAERVAGGRTGIDAARALVRWVSTNVRYVKVYLQQMDGWVPHPAGQVLRNGFGDCKDQFVLLASLLRAKGIEAEPVLVDLERAWQPLPLSTPLQFNHCMAYLPEFDLYANPTDPYRDLGCLDIALSGKFVVIADPRGRVARTPPGNADQNQYHSVHDIEVTADGTMVGTSVIEARGRPAGGLRAFLVQAGTSEQAADDLLFDNATFASGKLRSSDPGDLSKAVRCEGEYREDIRIPMGRTIYLPLPSGLELANPGRIRELATGPGRKFPLVAGAVSVSMSRTIHLPDAYAFAAPPEGREIRTAVANYHVQYQLVAPNQLRMDSQVRLEQDVYSPLEYRELETVLAALAEDLRTILVAHAVDAE